MKSPGLPTAAHWETFARSRSIKDHIDAGRGGKVRDSDRAYRLLKPLIITVELKPRRGYEREVIVRTDQNRSDACARGHPTLSHGKTCPDHAAERRLDQQYRRP